MRYINRDMNDILGIGKYFKDIKRDILEDDIEQGFEYRSPPPFVDPPADATEMELYGPDYHYDSGVYQPTANVILFENKLLREFLLYEIEMAKKRRTHGKHCVIEEEEEWPAHKRIKGRFVSGQDKVIKYRCQFDNMSEFVISCRFFPQEVITGIELHGFFLRIDRDSAEPCGSLDMLVHREYLKQFSAGIAIEQRMAHSYAYRIRTEDPVSNEETNAFSLCIELNKYNVAIIGRYLLEGPLTEVFAKLPPKVKQTLELYHDRIEDLAFQLQETFPKLDGEITYALLEQIALRKGWDLSHLALDTIRALGGTRSSAVGSLSIPERGVVKKYVFKVTRDPNEIVKEFTILREAQCRNPLQYYLPSLCLDEIISVAGYHIILMDDMTDREREKDEQQEMAHRKFKERKKLGRGNDRHLDAFYHRLYVANLFHRQLASLVDSPLFVQSSTIQYYDPQQIVDILKPKLSMWGPIECLFSDFDPEVFSYLRERNTAKDCIVHNDMRGDNWVGRNKQFLIDYSNATRADCGGGIYRDMVRCAIDAELERAHPFFSEITFMDAIDFYFMTQDIEKTPEQMRQEYALLFAELHLEAYRHILIACKTIRGTDSYDAAVKLDYSIQRYEHLGRLAKKMARQFMK